MRGFTKKALVVLPKTETVNRMSSVQELNIRNSIRKLIKFFKDFDIELESFITNDIAREYNIEDIKWIIPDTPEDMHFITSGKIDGFRGEERGVYIQKYDNEARSKFKVARGLTDVERFDIIIKRDKFIANRYISDSKLVITFEKKSNAYYKIISNNEDDRIILRINPLNCVIEAEYSGNSIDPKFILNYDRAQIPVYSWEV